MKQGTNDDSEEGGENPLANTAVRRDLWESQRDGRKENERHGHRLPALNDWWGRPFKNLGPVTDILDVAVVSWTWRSKLVTRQKRRYDSLLTER